MLAPDLHSHSTFSIQDGLGTPKDVVARAKELGWGAACLTEHGWLGSSPSFYKACRENGISPILGCEFYVVPNEILGERGKEFRWKQHHLTVLALSAEGYHNLVAWTTYANRRENFYDRPRISLEAMAELALYPLHHNVILSGCLASELSSTVSGENGLVAAEAWVQSVKSLFPNLYIEVQAHGHRKFMEKGFTSYEEMVAQESLVREKLLALAASTGTSAVLTNDSHFQSPKQRESHLLLVAQKRSYGKRVSVSDYLPEYGYFTSYLQSMEKLAERANLPQEVVESAIEIANEANIKLDPLDNFKYAIPFSGHEDPIQKIRTRCKSRLSLLVHTHGQAARERFEMELSAMGDFAHYLLLMSDFIVEAHRQGILTNTRGSAANSLVCYCLKIHDIDPMPDAYNLLFSRFVNPARKKLPDIDIDIEKDRYEDFMRIVEEKMNGLEGEGQVVQICNYGTFANRSAFRLIADALGMDKDEQDEIAKLLPQMIDSGMVDEESDVYSALKNEYPEIYELTSGVFDAIKNLSQHACGWLFGTRDRPIEKWVPIALIASSGASVTAYDLKSLDDMGLVKGDFLRLRTLSVIQRTRRMLGQDSLDISDIPLDDVETFQMLREGRTEGVFTLQGKENRRGVVEVEAQSVHDVIASVAIYRPALTREKKHVLYNKRRKGVEEVSYAHPILEEILGPTYGVPIFQEQVMEICYGVGMSDAEVDDVYRAIKMAKGVGRGAKEAFENIKPAFFNACESSGINNADEIWKEVQASQGYGFNKGHATSYGLLGYRAAYLKCHYPAEFFTALLDVYPEKSKYIAAARSEGFKFLPPSVNRSVAGFSLDRTAEAIRVGLHRIKGLGPAAVNEILSGQPFSTYQDFKERTSRRSLNGPRVEMLAALGALTDLGVKGESSDALEFEALGFVLSKPQAFKGVKPRYVGERRSESGWWHQGRYRGADITEGRSSVSKLFWIPPVEDKRGFKLLDLKASPWAQVKTYLLHAVDENGIVFHLMANEDKPGEVEILKYLAKLKGCTVCCEGSVRQPFLNDGPLGFRFYGISGADYKYDPQVWNTQNGAKKKIVQLHEKKKVLRRNRGVYK